MGRGRTTTAKGVPLETEPGYKCYLKGVGRLLENGDEPTDEISPIVTWTGSGSERDDKICVEQYLREGMSIGLQAQS